MVRLIFLHFSQETLMLLVANLAYIQNDAKNFKMTETMAYGYSSERTQRELSNDYQHERV